MRVFGFHALLLALSIVAAPASAQEPDCADPQSQAEMTSCAGLDYERADVELNAVWAEALENAKSEDFLGIDDGRPGYEESLRDAQRAWIRFRDSACQYEGYQARGGTMEPMLINMCLARMTKARTEELRNLVQTMGTQ